MRRQGKSLNEISVAFNISKGYAGQICRSAGMGGKLVDQRSPEQQVAEYVSRSGFDYVGGYTMSKNPITVRCRDCGRTFERQAHVFRDVVNGTWNAGNECPLCRRDRNEQRKRERREHAENEARIKAEQRARKEADLISRQTEERLAIHICKNCGQEYSIGATGYNSAKYCSEKCMKRYAMRVKNDRRIRKLKTRRHDTDITLEKLFRRDGGVCYLCGGNCDWNDIADGNASDNYPSIDHVKPVAKGGTHTWDNIKLAHKKCNTAKRDADYIPLV